MARQSQQKAVGKECEYEKCHRDKWNNREYCIWHAKVENKPVDELIGSRQDQPEDLSGAYLSDITLEDRITFYRCDLSESHIENVDLSGANFAGANMSNIEIMNSTLRDSYFRKADLSFSTIRQSDCSESMFFKSSFRESNILHVDLSESNISGAILNGSYIDHSNLYNAYSTSSEDLGTATITISTIGRTLVDQGNFQLSITEESQVQSIQLSNFLSKFSNLYSDLYHTIQTEDAELPDIDHHVVDDLSRLFIDFQRDFSHVDKEINNSNDALTKNNLLIEEIYRENPLTAVITITGITCALAITAAVLLTGGEIEIKLPFIRFSANMGGTLGEGIEELSRSLQEIKDGNDIED